MATKSNRNKRRAGKTGGASGLLDLVRRNLEKGNSKQALKDARVCYRQEPTAEHRRYLEFALIQRSQQLEQHGLREEARRVAHELLDLGPLEPSVQEAFPGLLLSLGMFDRLRDDAMRLSAGQQTDWEAKAADVAVRNPQDAPASIAGCRATALQIRAALERLYEGATEQALATVAGIPRGSPFADWVLFVRGLAAYYEKDAARTSANWDRLDPNRLAARIARPLACLVDGTLPPRTDSREQAGLRKLYRTFPRASVLISLEALSSRLASDDWRATVRALQQHGDKLRSMNPSLVTRLTRLVCVPWARNGNVSAIQSLSRAWPAPPLDPHWNHLLALAHQCADEDKAANAHWEKYLVDLEAVDLLSEAERNAASGLVTLHLARFFVTRTRLFSRCECGCSHEAEIFVTRDAALDFFRKCQRYLPRHLPGYHELASFHEAYGDVLAAADAHRQAVCHVPDCLESLHYLAQHHLNRDEPVEAAEHVQRIRQVRPLDASAKQLLWYCHAETARVCAERGQIDQGRAAFLAADELMPGASNHPAMIARKAAFELKAGQSSAAERIITRGVGELYEPAACWLAMAIESAKYGLPIAEVWSYENRWKEALRGRRRAETAGWMCKILYDAKPRGDGEQPFDAATWRKYGTCLQRYLVRCGRLKWSRDPLLDACSLLRNLDDWTLLGKFVKRGMRLFPKEPRFHHLAGDAVLKGRFKWGAVTRARRHYEKALELAQASDDPQHTFIAEVRKCLTELELGGQLPGHRLPPRHGAWDAYEDDEGDEDDVDDADEGFPGFGSLPAFPGNLPPDVRKKIEEVARRTGLSPEAVLVAMLGDFFREYSED